MPPVGWLEPDRLLTRCTKVGCPPGQGVPGSRRSPGILREQQERVRVNSCGNRIVDRVKIGAQENKLLLVIFYYSRAGQRTRLFASHPDSGNPRGPEALLSSLVGQPGRLRPGSPEGPPL